MEFYGFFPWIVIQRITLPLCVFFRFHSTVISNLEFNLERKSKLFHADKRKCPIFMFNMIISGGARWAVEELVHGEGKRWSRHSNLINHYTLYFHGIFNARHCYRNWMLINLMLWKCNKTHLIEKENQVCIPNGKLLRSVHQIENFYL